MRPRNGPSWEFKCNLGSLKQTGGGGGVGIIRSQLVKLNSCRPRLPVDVYQKLLDNYLILVTTLSRQPDLCPTGTAGPPDDGLQLKISINRQYSQFANFPSQIPDDH